jgi:hypothetical protein
MLTIRGMGLLTWDDGKIPQRRPITLATAHGNPLTSLFVSISR